MEYILEQRKIANCQIKTFFEFLQVIHILPAIMHCWCTTDK